MQLARITRCDAREIAAYSVAKALCNGFWLGVCGLVLCGPLTSLRTRSAVPSGTLCLLLAFAYSFLLHGVVESVGKYHVLWSASLALLAAGGTYGFLSGDRASKAG